MAPKAEKPAENPFKQVEGYFEIKSVKNAPRIKKKEDAPKIKRKEDAPRQVYVNVKDAPKAQLKNVVTGKGNSEGVPAWLAKVAKKEGWDNSAKTDAPFGKTIMTTEQRIEALGQDAHLAKVGSRYVWVPDAFSKVKVEGNDLVYKPGVPSLRYVRTEGNQTRAGNGAVDNTKVRQPRISYADMTRAARFSK